MANKEKLRKLASGTEDYSAKGEYMEKKGYMGKDAIYNNERVTVSDGGRGTTTKQTSDTTTVRGKPVKTYPTARDWWNDVLSERTLNPAINNARAFKYNGTIYGIPSGGGSPTETQV